MANIKAKATIPTNKDIPPVVFFRPDIEEGFFGKNTAKDKGNIAIMVSKKNFKTAVSRNRAKRLVKEAVRQAAKEVKQPIEAINLKINAQKSILDVQFQRLVELIKKEINKTV